MLKIKEYPVGFWLCVLDDKGDDLPFSNAPEAYDALEVVTISPPPGRGRSAKPTLGLLSIWHDHTGSRVKYAYYSGIKIYPLFIQKGDKFILDDRAYPSVHKKTVMAERLVWDAPNKEVYVTCVEAAPRPDGTFACGTHRRDNFI